MAVVAVERGSCFLEEADRTILLLLELSRAVELPGSFAAVVFVCNLILLGRADDFASLGLAVSFSSEVMFAEVVLAFGFEPFVLFFMFQISRLYAI